MRREGMSLIRYTLGERRGEERGERREIGGGRR